MSDIDDLKAAVNDLSDAAATAETAIHEQADKISAALAAALLPIAEGEAIPIAIAQIKIVATGLRTAAAAVAPVSIAPASVETVPAPVEAAPAAAS